MSEPPGVPAPVFGRVVVPAALVAVAVGLDEPAGASTDWLGWADWPGWTD